MAYKLIMTTIFASTLLIFALFLQLPAAAEEDHIQSNLSSDECEIPHLYGCMFYLSGLHKNSKDRAGFNPFQDQLEKQRLIDCCDELEELDQECLCPAINQTVMQQLQNRCYEDGDEKMDVVRAAINLPERCQLQLRFCLVSFKDSGVC